MHELKNNFVRLKGLIILTLIACMLILGGCKQTAMLCDIAYDVNEDSGYTVYIAENGKYVPYLVLTNDYNGNCLLLREHLLDEPRRYNPARINAAYIDGYLNNDTAYYEYDTAYYEYGNAYYEYSEIDNYLNNEFLDTLSSEVRNMIIDSKIDITANESLSFGGKRAIPIKRAVFLLSYTEVDGEGSSTNLWEDKGSNFLTSTRSPIARHSSNEFRGFIIATSVEGKKLSYFKNDELRVAKYSSGEADSWWLRTPNTCFGSVVCGVDFDGVIGLGLVETGPEDFLSGIRPAFCLPGDTVIYQDKVDGETVYLIKHMPPQDAKTAEDLTLSNIVYYDVNQDLGYTVYVAENEIYVPYLVLTDDYNGNCLLLREYLLDELGEYNSYGRDTSYYENSEIDNYLNNEFLDTLSSEIKNIIINSEIVITVKKSQAIYETETKTIDRAVFLLSYNELRGHEDKSITLVEDAPLSYFKNNESRIARFSSDEAYSWWLRTVDTFSSSAVCRVFPNGLIGLGGVGSYAEDYVSGIRPAFCLPGDTAIYTDEVDGETVYLIRF